MTHLSLDLASTKWDKSNKLGIMNIGCQEAELFDTLILGFRSIDLNRSNSVFQLSSYVATESLRYVTFIDNHIDNHIGWNFFTNCPQKSFFLGSPKNGLLNRFQRNICYTLQRSGIISIISSLYYALCHTLIESQSTWDIIFYNRISYAAPNTSDPVLTQCPLFLAMIFVLIPTTSFRLATK